MKLTLVGAGPGDPDLITVKGIRALKQADVVMYDALVHPDLLDHCRPDALKVYVGKRRGAYSCMQEDINPLIVRPRGAVALDALVVRK
jgi:uroporphyrin-III C-methyltransferase